MMNVRDLAFLLMFSSTVLAGTTIVFAALWVRARERVWRTKLDAKTPQDLSNDRLEHLVNAVESMAIEVERISEAQRFTAQVLAERNQVPAQPKRVPERIITPH